VKKEEGTRNAEAGARKGVKSEESGMGGSMEGVFGVYRGSIDYRFDGITGLPIFDVIHALFRFSGPRQR